MSQHPWTSGPREILDFGVSLLEEDTDTQRRIAMILIDNAVELMIKTYLSLPKRVTQITLSREKFNEIAESFPKLLDALEVHAADRVSGINLGEIEWFHRVRNELYHQGHGLTAERDKVKVYAELAMLLYENLFDSKFEPGKERTEKRQANLLHRFLQAWIELEQLANQYKNVVDPEAARRFSLNPIAILEALPGHEILTQGEMEKLRQLRQTRNQIVHTQTNLDILKPDMVTFIEKMIQKVRKALDTFNS